MSIRYEREQMFCTHLRQPVVQLVEYSTPPGLSSDAELEWVRGAVECLQRKTCKDTCPGEAVVLQPATPQE